MWRNPSLSGCLCEQRLLSQHTEGHRTSGHQPEHTQEPVQPGQATRNADAERVQQRRADAARNPELSDDDRAEIAKEYLREQEKLYPKVRESVFSRVRNTIRSGFGKVLLAGAFALPPLGISLYAADKVLSKTPVVRTVYDIPRAIAFSTAEKAADILSAAAASPALVVDAGLGAARVSGRVLDATAGELYRDTKKAINYKFDYPAGTNPLAGFLTMLKGIGTGLIQLPGRIAATIGGAFEKHPVGTLFGGAILLGMLEQYKLAGTVAKLAGWFGQLVQGIIGHISSAPVGAIP